MTGLFHVAFLYPDRPGAGPRTETGASPRVFPIDGAADHGVSEAIYFRDPDGNGIEIYRDRPEIDWPRDSTGRACGWSTIPLTCQALLAEA
jgi:catechol 2,3-dioxygenase